VIRFLPSLPGYVYATEKGNTIVVNQFVAGKAKIQLSDGEVEIIQKTNYPWDGSVKILCTPKNKSGSTAKRYTLKIRQPEKNQYESYEADWTKPAEFNVVRKLETKRIIANPHVVTNRGRVAIQRGTLVYCFEECDNKVPIKEIELPRDPQFKEEFRKDLLGGIVVLKCKNADGQELTAIPYYAWDNREMGAMTVWVRQEGLPESTPPDTGTALYAELKPETLHSGNE
jgi:DUF1680 family protein